MLAHASARMVADLLHGQLPPEELEGWQMNVPVAAAKSESRASLPSPPAAETVIAD